MKITNYSSRYMAINYATDLAKALQTTRPESPFQVGYSQLKATRELEGIFDADIKTPNRDTLPTLPSPLTKKSYKLPRVEYQTAPTLRVYLDEESEYR